MISIFSTYVTNSVYKDLHGNLHVYYVHRDHGAKITFNAQTQHSLI